MKPLRIYDDLHTQLKIAAVRRGRTLENLGSELLRNGLTALKEDEEAGSSDSAAKPALAGKGGEA